MNCPTCGDESHVIDSRPAKQRSIRRRRQCGRGHRFTTYERMEPAEKPIDMKWLFKRVKQAIAEVESDVTENSEQEQPCTKTEH